LINWLTTGGIERWLLQMAAQIDRSVYAIDFCCKGTSTGELAYIAKEHGAQVWHLPLDAPHVRYLSGLRALIKKEGYELIHNHLAVYAGAPTILARAMSLPSIVSFHNTDHASDVLSSGPARAARAAYGEVSIRTAVQLADLVTGCSEGVSQAHIKRYGAPPARTRTLYYGVSVPTPLDTATRQHVRAGIGVGSQVPLIMHIGRMSPQKNHSGLLEIFRRTLHHLPDAMLVLVGDGPLRPEIEAQIAAANLQANVRVLGIRNDVEQLFGAADLLLLPSLWEGLGMVVIEAGAASVPSIGSDVPGIREAIVHGKTGLLAPAEDVDSFVKYVRLVFENPQLRHQLGQQAHQRVAAQFSREASARNVCALYDTCLNPNQRY
jgi:glycosyltransferase involved in cell wall biosynthesis